MSKLKAACAVLLTVAVLLASACSGTKQTSVAMRVPPKAKKTVPEPGQTEESELDDLAYYGGPAVLRKNLPLAGTQWEWEGNLGQDLSGGLGQSGGYHLIFKPNGWFDFQADCRHGAGIYEINGQHIALAVIKSTHSTCQKGSKAEEFASALEAAKTYRKADGKLYFDLKRETKTMVFALKP